MWFGILGPMLVRDEAGIVEVVGARQRVLLGAMLLHPGTAVPAGTLAEIVWDGAPPAGAATTLRSHVLRLRRVLGPEAGSRLVTRYPGYLIDAAEEEVDVLRFTRLCREGGAAFRAGPRNLAFTVLGEALGLWRGDPLADVPAGLLHRDEVPQLQQSRLLALEWWADAGLHLGRHGEVVPELQLAAACHPLREHLHGLLMLALYRDGRQGEALAVYRHARKVLADELGAEPGAALRDLHQRILSADPALAAAPVALRAQPDPASRLTPDIGPAPAGQFSPREDRRIVPRQLPAPVAHFVGRGTELATLSELLDRQGADTPGAVVISAIGGTAGVGKTALAVQWARQHAARFPDGQLYVNLRGYDPAQPVTAADALAGFLRALGLPGQEIPPEEDERAARYRSLLDGRQMLIVLDNAGSAEQVRSLLPGGPACTVVVTSRDALAGLVARHGAVRLDLDLLPLADAASLLRELIGERARADPGAVTALADRCARLPLALRVAAELAVARPTHPLAGLVGELADQQRRLDLLDAGGDPRTAVRSVFSWSFRRLDADAARAFRTAGLHPGRDFDGYAVAALADTSLDQGRRMLDTLARAHLVQPVGAGRYSLHDLLRGYARELAAADGEAEQRTALSRLVGYYLCTAAEAINTLHPAERSHRPHVPPSASPAPPVSDPGAARVWLDAERATLIAVSAHAAEQGQPLDAIRLAAILFRYLDRGGHFAEAAILHSHALIAARQAGDSTAEAASLIALGVVALQQGRHQQGTGHLEQALALSQQAGDNASQARALSNLSMACYLEGRYGQGSEWSQQALALYRAEGDQAGETVELEHLGLFELRQGRYREASEHLQCSLALARANGNRVMETDVLVTLGEVSLRQGAYQRAAGLLRRALALAQTNGNRSPEVSALARLGEACLRLGRHEQAASHLRQALALAREIGDREDEADALNGLGETILAAGQPGLACAQHAAALGVAGQIGGKLQQARAHHGLARSHEAVLDPSQARPHWQQALALYSSLGVPEADQVRAEIAAADHDANPES
jgi:DNA-binding SARP family transcriptional activator/tetratricopeptide (TPR) repeat protein